MRQPGSLRRLNALRNLAARPGTDHEGEVARAKLARYEKSSSTLAFKETSGSGISFVYEGDGSDFHWPTEVKCRCGSLYAVGTRCQNRERHEAIHQDLKNKFPKGTRVYYNYWAYGENEPATVIGFVKTEKSPTQWGWIRLKFDRLKTPRNAPVYTDLGCHISRNPLSPDKAGPLKYGHAI